MVKRHKWHYGVVTSRLAKLNRDEGERFDVERMREKIEGLVYLIRSIAAEARTKSKRKWFQEWARRLDEVAGELKVV